MFSHKTVNIHLQDKSEWFLVENTPIGKVPTIQLDDRIFFDSLIVNYYLDIMYPETKLNPDDPYQLASDKPKMVDLNVWPHMMRIPHLAYSFSNQEVELSPDRFPAVTSWINNMEKVPAVQQTNLDKDHYKQFIESYIAKKVDYDVFIEE
ncbi:GSTO1-like protein [Mya arenaria]|uniref:GSTO1-like protein n=1 Tax=Mya arenaria TaxID=6604 RepID=A0ABY7EUE4_MYAAR|nr:GSTO1-like protein [Mya arenaria]